MNCRKQFCWRALIQTRTLFTFHFDSEKRRFHRRAASVTRRAAFIWPGEKETTAWSDDHSFHHRVTLGCSLVAFFALLISSSHIHFLLIKHATPRWPEHQGRDKEDSWGLTKPAAGLLGQRIHRHVSAVTSDAPVPVKTISWVSCLRLWVSMELITVSSKEVKLQKEHIHICFSKRALLK